MDNNNETCPVCHQTILPDYYFCPNCGASLKEKVKDISALTQIGLYALALFLPPLGLWPGIKYLMKSDQKAKQIGIIVIVLTVISSVITIWAIFNMFSVYLNQLNAAVSF